MDTFFKFTVTSEKTDSGVHSAALGLKHCVKRVVVIIFIILVSACQKNFSRIPVQETNYQHHSGRFWQPQTKRSCVVLCISEAPVSLFKRKEVLVVIVVNWKDRRRVGKLWSLFGEEAVVQLMTLILGTFPHCFLLQQKHHSMAMAAWQQHCRESTPGFCYLF